MELARRIAAKVYRSVRGSVEFEDVFAHALGGLIEAAIRYDASASTPFGLFAQYRVRGAIYDWLRSMGYIQRARHQRKPQARASHEGGASRAEGQPGAVAYDPARPDFVLLSALEDEQADTHEAMLSAAPLADVALARKHACGFLDQALRQLSRRERHFLYKHYFEGKTMSESGAELGLSRYQSCRLHARAVERLRAAFAASGIERFADM